MSRSNPTIKKRRQAKKTLLFFGEGFCEEIFLKYLKFLYHPQDCGVSIKIKSGKGGDPRNIVLDASKIPGDYDWRVVVLDDDKTKEEMVSARTAAKAKGIKLIENKPCLEALFLKILDKNPVGKKSSWCKAEFELKYLDKKKRGDLEDYPKIFPKKLLEIKKLKIEELNQLIKLMENK